MGAFSVNNTQNIGHVAPAGIAPAPSPSITPIDQKINSVAQQRIKSESHIPPTLFQNRLDNLNQNLGLKQGAPNAESKMGFLHECLTKCDPKISSVAKNLNDNASRIPVLDKAMNQVKLDFMKMDRLSPGEIKDHQAKIETKLQNIHILANAAGVHLNNFSPQNLAHVKLDDIMEKACQENGMDMKQLLKGEAPIDKSQTESLNKSVKAELQKLNHVDTSKVPDGAKVKESVIKVTARVFEVSRVGMGEATELKEIKSSEMSANTVSRITETKEFIAEMSPDAAKALLANKKTGWMLSEDKSDPGKLVLTVTRSNGKIEQEIYQKTGQKEIYIDSRGVETSLKEIKEEMKLSGRTHINTTTLGFFKTGAGGETAGRIMESMIYTISGKLGIPEFAATKKSEFYTHQNISNSTLGDSTTVLFDTKGFPVEGKNSINGVKGSVQAALEGVTYEEAVQTKSIDKISIEQMGHATMTSMVLGMFDAHAGNMIVDPNGNIKFFDNTRSMPNSNEFIDRGLNNILVPYRFGLMSSPKILQDLKKEELDFLKKELVDLKGNMPKVEKFFANKSSGQDSLETLPEGWLDKKAALDAMKERIDRISAALDNPKVKNLRDLVLESNPTYKMAAALRLAANLPNDIREGKTEASLPELQLKYFNPVTNFVDNEYMANLIEECAARKLDPREIVNLSCDPKKSFDELSKDLFKIVNKKSALDAATCRSHGQDLLDEFTQSAKIDYKDRSRASIAHTNKIKKDIDDKKLAEEKAEQDEVTNSKKVDIPKAKPIVAGTSLEQMEKINAVEVREIDYKTKDSDLEELIDDIRSDEILMIKKSTDESYHVYFKNKEGELQNIPVDLDSEYGKVKLGAGNEELPPMSPQEMVDWVQSRQNLE